LVVAGQPAIAAESCRQGTADGDGVVAVCGETSPRAGDRRVVVGSGELLGEIEVDLPAGAQTISFRLQASPAIDWNKNSEVVISEAVFRP
jgi:hypothetical protein